MQLRKQLSGILKHCKKLSGMTYDDIVDETGFSKSSIRYALNGGEGVSIDTFEKIFVACGVEILEIEVLFMGD